MLPWLEENDQTLLKGKSVSPIVFVLDKMLVGVRTLQCHASYLLVTDPCKTLMEVKTISVFDMSCS